MHLKACVQKEMKAASDEVSRALGVDKLELKDEITKNKKVF